VRTVSGHATSSRLSPRPGSGSTNESTTGASGVNGLRSGKVRPAAGSSMRHASSVSPVATSHSSGRTTTTSCWATASGTSTGFSASSPATPAPSPRSNVDDGAGSRSRELTKGATDLVDLVVADRHRDHEVVDGVVRDVRQAEPVDLEERRGRQPAEALVAVDQS